MPTFCYRCGSPIGDDEKFCGNCGAIQPEERQDQTTYRPPEQTAQTQESPPAQHVPDRQEQQANIDTQETQQQTTTDRYGGWPMKWHKFLVYFLLWLGALLNLISAVTLLTGLSYGVYRDLVYLTFPALRAVDTAYGILVIIAVALAVYTALKLMGLRRGAPKLLTVLYAYNAAACVIYVIFASAAMSGFDTSGLMGTAIGGLVGSVVMIIINHVYYKKRAHLFVN